MDWRIEQEEHIKEQRERKEKEMKAESSVLIIGLSVGVVIGVLLTILALFCMMYKRKRSQIGNNSSRRDITLPIRANGANSCTIMSDWTIGPESPVKSGKNGMTVWLEGFGSTVVCVLGIPEYSYKQFLPRYIGTSNPLISSWTSSMRARVVDFGLSREEMADKDFTKKSDLYSFGVLLFELIAGRNPQQGLMEYVEQMLHK